MSHDMNRRGQKVNHISPYALIKKINTERIVKDNIFWTYLRNMDRGIDYDIRKDIYNEVRVSSLDSFEAGFFNTQIKGLNYNFLVLGNKDLIDMKSLRKIGKVEVMDLDDLFNY